MGSSGRVLAVAWMNACATCATGIADQMQVIEDQPGGQRIQILQCTWCGDERACRPGWRTRCHLCLDDRTSPIHIEDIELVREAMVEQGHLDDLRSYRGLDSGEDIDDWTLHEAISYDLVDGTLVSYARPGWTVLATDIHGLPWDWREASTRLSHGTWGRHDACGSIQKMERGRSECPICPPEDGSRTFRAKKDDPHLLYLGDEDPYRHRVTDRRPSPILTLLASAGSALLAVCSCRCGVAHWRAWRG